MVIWLVVLYNHLEKCIPSMKWTIKFMFQTFPNHQPVLVQCLQMSTSVYRCLHICKRMNLESLRITVADSPGRYVRYSVDIP